jgi:hypothetical protein
MRAVNAGKFAVIAIFICSLFSGLCPSTQAVAIYPGLMTGYVFDEGGNPVSAANVTLWQDGMLWLQSKSVYASSANPQTSDIHNGNEGYYLFGVVDPGNYTVRAEKDGHEGSAGLVFGYNSVIINVTLTGYRIPSFSEEQLSYTGAITGTVYDMSGQDMTNGANVSLWQDGQMLKMPGNPQVGLGNAYLFEHLAPGRYEVRAVMHYVAVFKDYPANISVNVSNDVVSADIVLPFSAPLKPEPTPPGWAPNSSTAASITPKPSLIASPRSPNDMNMPPSLPAESGSPPTPPPIPPLPTPRPSPSPGIAMVVLSLGIGILLVSIIRRN